MTYLLWDMGPGKCYSGLIIMRPMICQISFIFNAMEIIGFSELQKKCTDSCIDSTRPPPFPFLFFFCICNSFATVLLNLLMCCTNRPHWLGILLDGSRNLVQERKLHDEISWLCPPFLVNQHNVFWVSSLTEGPCLPTCFLMSIIGM